MTVKVMTKKIVFLDIDGTIVNNEKKIPDSTKLAVRMLKENNVHVAIATGRPLHLLRQIDVELGIDSYVCYNGAYVVYDGKVLYKRSIDMKHLEELTRFAKEKGHALRYFTTDSMALSVCNEYVQLALGKDYPDPLVVDEEFYKQNEIYQVVAFSDKNNSQLYSEKVPSLDYYPWGNNAMDVVPKSSSKAVGINKMIEHLGIEMENVYAFGDGANDVEMLKSVGTGVAMGNASDYVKGFADFVTKDVDDDGIYHGLKHFNLI